MVLEDCLCLSLTACKKMGYFVPNADASGVIKWGTREKVAASIGFETNLLGVVPYAVLTYNYKGNPVRTEITLRYKQSNLKAGTGFYYFVCPVTGLSCRKLYLVNGRFVSRMAFRPLYRQQAENYRNPIIQYYEHARKCEDILFNSHHRRRTYRGKQTPWGRKYEKAERRYITLFDNAYTKEFGKHPI